MKQLIPGTSVPCLLALCAVLSLWPETAAAQISTNVVWDQLQAVYTTVSADGYASQNYIVGKLNQDQTDSWSLTLYGGLTYLILGACDGDCKDIDIRLYDDNGNEIDSDTSEDAVPALEGSVSTTGQFTIEVHMYSCTTEPCYFGLGIFSK